MKKLSFLLALVLLFSFCLGGCGQPQPNPKLDDLNMLCDTLEKNHYNLYANVSEEEFQAEREKIARQTAKMTDEEFYWSVCHLVSLVGDAHTMVGNTGEPFMTALLWSIKKFDDGWYILKLDQKNEQYLGMRVTAINDVPIDEAVERARQVISYETDSWFWNLVPQTLAWRGALEYLEIAKEGEPVTVTVEMQDGAEQSFELTATDDWDERSQMVSFQREAVPRRATRTTITGRPSWTRTPTSSSTTSVLVGTRRCRSLPSRFRQTWKAATRTLSSTCATTMAEMTRSSFR